MKQTKFELTLIFCLNLAPAIILLAGPEYLFMLFALLTNLFGLLYLESKRGSEQFSLIIIVQFMLISRVFSTTSLPVTAYIHTLLNQAKPVAVAVVGTLRAHIASTLAFGVFLIYSLSREQVKSAEKRLKKSLAYERLYESSSDI